MPASRNLIGYIMLALVIWGGLLAGGAWLYGGSRHALKAAVILGCVALFLGVWALLLKYRASIQARQSVGERPAKPAGPPRR